MKIKVAFFDEYNLYGELNFDYIDVYRILDKKNNEVFWIHELETEELTTKEVNNLNNNPNIKSWEIFNDN